jgi:very-short-patch-repair endonuclease
VDGPGDAGLAVDDAVDKAIAALARRHGGHVARRQLRDVGLGSDAIAYRVKVGRLIAVHAGVYAVGHLPTSPIDRAAGALLACGPGAVLSHGSAASLWGIRKTWSAPFDVTVPSDRPRRGIHIHRSRALTRRDIRIQLGLHVTSPARTLLDVARTLSDKGLTRAVNDLRLSNHLRLPDLAELLKRLPKHPGAKRLQPFIKDPTGPTRSELEDAFVKFTRRYGLPTPQMNTTVNGYEVDALFPEHGVIVELDGYGFHSDRESFEGDRERDAKMLAAGLPTVRVTWERIDARPGPEADRLRAILEAAKHRH